MNQAPGEAAVLLGASSLSILKLKKGQIYKSIRGVKMIVNQLRIDEFK
jgi:hypothetical protein